jgi:hypothetical protein
MLLIAMASSISSSSGSEDSAIFKKVIMKLSGNVRWLAGLVFERNIDGGGRSFDFRPLRRHPEERPPLKDSIQQVRSIPIITDLG